MAFTAEEEARIEAAVARIKASERPDPGFECAHCGVEVSTLFEDKEACPGCGAPVCRSCYKVRRLKVNQTCRPNV
jgi:rRNA maturation endonuclease Nob1